MTTEQDVQVLLTRVREMLEAKPNEYAHDWDRLWNNLYEAEKPFRPKKKRVGYTDVLFNDKGNCFHNDVRLRVIEYDDDVRERLSPSAGVRPTKVLSIIEHNGISNETKAARIMDLIESAAVEIEDA